ncbi:UDP-N-acetylmuramate dehydrogenase [Propionibacterium australiense]|uniref:UDP-N-acetylenolpyruvoylglucosamine reductase n=1 Tax=Propionibacterium australiense TaxID=119981 RepID=A0A383S5P6_9ACTN|nr:UDP-N-acetylmuramate dehydrogenase [Propionibacterium australiense]RLP11941.1 UDP-N-acetylmuramate dehydrogenase [Propionibacterium australiense]RLP12579.1 UDP-N-acetylmuramate dehydrogenase [Propionibacterium australiense]SYZ32596.1 UDP-N-acetylmuramate dehydrogenase --> transferred, now [Propionibacterium australiense]VEH91653.1 UDP-N-acetylenolpyruvoylglucosamine reductase [Propionibacterium australiense]
MSIEWEEDVDRFPAAGEGCRLDRADGFLEPRTVPDSPLLSEHTSFHIGGPARRFVIARTERELIDAVTEADEAGEPLLVLSGGSNVLISDAGFDGTVVRVDNHGIRAEVSACGGAVVRVGAGEVWDDFVAFAVRNQWRGPEALSGIPGLVGSTVVQNVGAYGADVGQYVYQVRTWDRETRGYRTFANADCGFAYRDSVFKQTRSPGSPTGRYVILEVVFQFLLGDQSMPIAYAELAGRLGVEPGEHAPSALVREHVLALRAGKGMVIDPADHDTWSAGSFFTNPIMSAEQAARLPAEAPRFPQPDGRVKSSAAWLIDHAGFHKGFGDGPAGLSTKHTLALTNRGNATAEDVSALARTIRDGVLSAYGVTLVPEPVLVGVQI